MKIKRFLAMIMVLAISVSLFVIPTYASETDESHNHDHIEIYFADDNISPEIKEKATAYFLNGGATREEDTATYGLTCTLFGHKLITTTTYLYRHKVKTTSPRCVREAYAYDTCERCNYENSTLLSSVYIKCCA